MPPHARPPLERFVDKLARDPVTKCWNWTAYVDPSTGYGLFRMPKGTTQAHRAAYELLVGPIPVGLSIDHRCRNKACVNPAHIEPVTPQVNTDRGPAARRMFCIAGHAMTADNCGNRSDGKRYCKTCHREKARAWRAAERRKYLERHGL